MTSASIKSSVIYSVFVVPPLMKSGRNGVFLRHSPLRTVRASFPAYGSSLFKTPYGRSQQFTVVMAMNLSMAVGVKEYKVG